MLDCAASHPGFSAITVYDPAATPENVKSPSALVLVSAVGVPLWSSLTRASPTGAPATSRTVPWIVAGSCPCAPAATHSIGTSTLIATNRRRRQLARPSSRCIACEPILSGGRAAASISLPRHGCSTACPPARFTGTQQRPLYGQGLTPLRGPDRCDARLKRPELRLRKPLEELVSEPVRCNWFGLHGKTKVGRRDHIRLRQALRDAHANR